MKVRCRQDIEAQLKQVQAWQRELEQKRADDIRRAKEEEARLLREAEMQAKVERERQRIKTERLAAAFAALAAEHELEEKRRMRGDEASVWLLPTALSHWNDVSTEDTPCIRHVSLCCNDGIMIIYDNGKFSYHGIPTALHKRLVGLQRSIGMEFAAFSPSDPACYFVKFGNGKIWWAGVPVDFAKAINESSSTVSYVAFGASSSASSCASPSLYADSDASSTEWSSPSPASHQPSQSSWYIEFADGSSQWALSSRHSAKIKTSPVDFLSLGANDEMFIRYTNGRYAWIDPPKETQAALNRYTSKGWDVRQVILGTHDTYVLRYSASV